MHRILYECIINIKHNGLTLTWRQVVAVAAGVHHHIRFIGGVKLIVCTANEKRVNILDINV